MTNTQNPLNENLERIPDPCTIVIFGASGDLTKRKLIPALYNLTIEHRLPTNFSIIGYARSEMTSENYRQSMFDAVQKFSATEPQTSTWHNFEQGVFYFSGKYDNINDYNKLRIYLENLDHERKTNGNKIYYLSVPPNLISPIIENLGKAGLAKNSPNSWTRIIIEKPFGHDLNTAQELNKKINSVFNEDQIYRIDHYRAKETVQNIVVMRFANGIFEPIWNRNYIDHIQITAAESVGVEGRGGYYDSAGATRDMLQNHLLQLLALVAMEPPVSLDSTQIRDESIKVIKSIHPISTTQVHKFSIRAQYTNGWVGGVEVPSYREELGVDAQSNIETFAALKLYIDNWRWADVPFYLRSGKRLMKRATEIAIQFRNVPLHLFQKTSADFTGPNLLIIRVQPDEGLTLRLNAKVPGQAMHLRSVNMDFRYGNSFGVRSSDAYEKLILDCMLGDGTLFTRRDMVEAGWALVMPILDFWQESKDENLYFYPAGSWGPEEANKLLMGDRAWRKL